MNRKVAIAVAAAAVFLLWFLWPSRKITNRDSTGTTIVAFGDSYADDGNLFELAEEGVDPEHHRGVRDRADGQAWTTYKCGPAV